MLSITKAPVLMNVKVLPTAGLPSTNCSRQARRASGVLRPCKSVEMQNYQFNCHGVEQGQCYTTSSAIVRDAATFPAPARDPELYLSPYHDVGRVSVSGVDRAQW
jgi:hypothetical protein